VIQENPKAKEGRARKNLPGAGYFLPPSLSAHLRPQLHVRAGCPHLIPSTPAGDGAGKALINLLYKSRDLYVFTNQLGCPRRDVATSNLVGVAEGRSGQ
jgi:hypothetical protein